MKEITSDNKVYAIVDNINSLEDGVTWYGKESDYIQVCRQNFDTGKKFATHRHIDRPREIPKTQEVLIVINGGLSVTIYDNDKNLIDTQVITPAGVIIFYDGYHGFEALSPTTVFYEVKHGQFVGVEQDKELLDATD